MAYSSWTNPPSRHFRSGRGGYSMGGGPQTSISALQTISNPASVASIASPVMPSSELPFSTQPATESIAAATRAPGPKRYTGTPIVTGEKETGGLVPGSGSMYHPGGPMMPPMGQTPGIPGPIGMPGGLSGTTPYGGSSQGHSIPSDIKGNPAAIADWRKSGLPFSQWTQTLGASQWF